MKMPTHFIDEIYQAALKVWRNSFFVVQSKMAAINDRKLDRRLSCSSNWLYQSMNYNLLCMGYIRAHDEIC